MGPTVVSNWTQGKRHFPYIPYYRATFLDLTNETFKTVVFCNVTTFQNDSSTKTPIFMGKDILPDFLFDQIFDRLAIWLCASIRRKPYKMMSKYCSENRSHVDGQVMGECNISMNSNTDQLGAVSIRKTVLPGMAIPMLKIRRPNGRLIFNMEIAIRR